MNDFLTKLSGQVTGAMIIGTLFPVLLFLLILVLVVLPVTPYGHQYADLLKDPQNWKGIYAVVATLILLLLTVVMYQLNNPLIRLYEGYPWKESLIGRLLIRKQKRRWKHATAMRDGIFGVSQAARLERVRGELKQSLSTKYSDFTLELSKEFPYAPEFILPTRLGNVIRAFETYTIQQYNLDAIVLWPRLQAVLDTNYAQAVDGVQSAFSFMLNLSFLSTLLAFFLAAVGLHWRYPGYLGWFQGWELWVVVLLVLSWLAYEGAITRAVEWGLTVETAFDLYRLPLLQKLGYEIKPNNLTEERQMWDIVGYHLGYPGDGLCCDLPYRSPQLWVITEPACAKLSCSRTVTPIDDSTIQVRIVISNLDPTRLGVDSILLKDEIPAGFTYLRDTAVVNGAPVTLEADSPLKVRLGPLAYNDVRTVVYCLKAQPKSATQ